MINLHQVNGVDFALIIENGPIACEVYGEEVILSQCLTSWNDELIPNVQAVVGTLCFGHLRMKASSSTWYLIDSTMAAQVDRPAEIPVSQLNDFSEDAISFPCSANAVRITVELLTGEQSTNAANHLIAVRYRIRPE
jgi:hypothetical protein